MGLDQYGFVRQREHAEREFYWRKHSRLQTFMEKLYHSKGNEGEFNCVDLELTKDDLLSLMRAVHCGFYHDKCEGGFFWGHQFQEEAASEYRKLDLEFVDAAIKAVDNGGTVVYSCWY